MRENCTYGSMRGSRRKTAKSVLRVAEGRAGVPARGVPLYSTPHGSPHPLVTHPLPHSFWYNTQWLVWWIMHRQQTDRNGKVRCSAAYPTGAERFALV